jgi:hypothetical protein
MTSKLKVLIINRKLKENENVVEDVFGVYGWDYGLIIFPPKEDSGECLIQVVSFQSGLRNDLSQIFNRQIDYEDEEDHFYDFDLQEIELDTFYEMLSQRFEVQTFNLTDIER